MCYFCALKGIEIVKIKHILKAEHGFNSIYTGVKWHLLIFYLTLFFFNSNILIVKDIMQFYIFQLSAKVSRPGVEPKTFCA